MPLDAAQNQMLDRIEADDAALDRVTHGGRDVVEREGLHQPQDLHELALARLTHARFEQTAQRHELLRQLPVGQRRGLVERIDLLLDQRQIMQRVEHEVLAFIGPRMTRDDLGATRDHDLMHVPAHKNLRCP